MSATTKDCTCMDPDLDRLRDLVAAGHDQRQVCHLLWGDSARIGNALAVEVAGQEARQIVRTGLTTAFPWLRLPDPTGVC